MERLTRPNVNVDETAAKFMGEEVKLQDINDRLLDLVLNGPTLNAVSKDKLRLLIRQLYGALKKYEDTGLRPEEVKDMAENAETRLLTWFEAKYGFPVGKLMDLCEAKEQGRLVVLPAKNGDTVFVVGERRVVECYIMETYLDDKKGTEYLVSFECGYPEQGDEVCKGCPFYGWHQQYCGEWDCDGAWGQGSIKGADFGKTVFLTREEAEQALKGGAE